MADFLLTGIRAGAPRSNRSRDRRQNSRREHRGLHYYTIGQRRGIRIPSNTDDKAYVVTGKRADDHALLVAFDGPEAPGLWTSECHIHSLSFIGEPITAPCRIECRVRYRDPRVKIEFTPVGSVTPDLRPPWRSRSQQPFRGPYQIRPAPARPRSRPDSMALYNGEKLLGGGVFA